MKGREIFSKIATIIAHSGRILTSLCAQNNKLMNFSTKQCDTPNDPLDLEGYKYIEETHAFYDISGAPPPPKSTHTSEAKSRVSKVSAWAPAPSSLECRPPGMIMIHTVLIHVSPNVATKQYDVSLFLRETKCSRPSKRK